MNVMTPVGRVQGVVDEADRSGQPAGVGEKHVERGRGQEAAAGRVVEFPSHRGAQFGFTSAPLLPPGVGDDVDRTTIIQW